MNERDIFVFNRGSQRIRLCIQDRGVAGDTFYTLILDPDAEPRIEQEIEYNQPFKSPSILTIPTDRWDLIEVGGKKLSDYVREKMPS